MSYDSFMCGNDKKSNQKQTKSIQGLSFIDKNWWDYGKILLYILKNIRIKLKQDILQRKNILEY